MCFKRLNNIENFVSWLLLKGKEIAMFLILANIAQGFTCLLQANPWGKKVNKDFKPFKRFESKIIN